MPSIAGASRVSLASLTALVAVAAACGSTTGGQTTKVPAGAGITTLSPPPPVTVPNGERSCRTFPGASALVPFGGALLVSTNFLVDHDYVYFTSFVDEKPNYYLTRVSKRGGPPERLGASGAQALVTDGTTIYAADTGGGVVAFPASGAALSRSAAAGAALAGDAVYVVVDTDDVDGGLLRVPLDGGLAAWADRAQAPSPWSILLDGATVYWQASFWYGPVFAQGPTGDARQVVPGDVYFPSGIALDGDTLFLGVKDVGLVATPKSGGAATTLAAGVDARGVLVDGAWVYWNDRESIHVMAKSGGDDTTLTTIEPTSAFVWDSIASDEDCLYFGVQNASNETALMTVAKHKPVR